MKMDWVVKTLLVVIAVLLLQSPRLAGFAGVAGVAARLRGAKA